MRVINRVLFSICIVIASYCNAQSADSIKPLPSSTDTNVRVIANSSVTGTIQKVQQYEQMSHGTSPGFRIQVHFGSDRNGANSAKTDFMLKYPGYSTYLTYQQPYFKVCVGDFRTKLEAVDVLSKVKKDYPGAFVVRDKINPPPLH
ncbi:MAG TPA: SPOR domain-containing protein [Bacteroidia bacterium]|nr:SPOR domain-containing protein [Bacteroidia bacterium]